MRRLSLLLSALFLASLAAFGCSDDDDNPPGGGSANGTMRVRMTDAPADFDSIVIGIREVAVHRAGTDTTTWLTFNTNANARIVDVLTLRNGVFLDLGTFTIPSGTVDRVRFLIDSTSYCVVSGVRRTLTIPAAHRSGVVITTSLAINGGANIDVGFDFDAARSLRAAGGGNWTLEPRCRLVPFAGSGSITGKLVPGDSLSAVYALSGADTVTATFCTTPGGDFALTLLPPGSYSVAVAGAVNLRDTTIASVTVTAGAATSLGTIPLSPLPAPGRAARGR